MRNLHQNETSLTVLFAVPCSCAAGTCAGVGQDGLAAIVGPVFLLLLELEGWRWRERKTLHLVCHILFVFSLH